MNRLKSYLFITALALTGLSCVWLGGEKCKAYDDHTPLKSYSGYSVSFYNVENLFDTINDPAIIDEEFLPDGKLKWNTQRYTTKLEHIVEALTLNQPKNPILIGMVEVENAKVVEDVAKTGRFAQTKYAVAHRDSPDARGIDCALMYDSERFRVLTILNLAVKLDSVPDFKTRDILYVKGELAKGKVLHVFVNHWPSRREGQKESEHKRIRAAEVLRAQIDEILKEDPKANILLMGDFNDHPNDVSIEQTLNAKPVTTKGADLFNLLYDDHAAGKGTHNFKGEWGVLDQFMVSSALFSGKGKIKLKSKDATIVYEEKLLFTKEDGSKKPSTTYGGSTYYGGYSDHLPIRLLLK